MKVAFLGQLVPGSSGPLTAKTIADAAGLPIDEVQDALAVLHTKLGCVELAASGGGAVSTGPIGHAHRPVRR